MKNLLVLVADYPNNHGNVSLMYVHTRNLYYIKNNLNVTVLNFAAETGYIKDGIKVITKKEYDNEKAKYDCLILHAANLRNHYSFLKREGNKFDSFIFFYHGHEVMKINKDYCPPYNYKKVNKINYFIQNVYDYLKLKIWKKYLISVVGKSEFVFVSNWMKEIFLENTKINPSLLNEKMHITYNNVGLEFENLKYDDSKIKHFDFVTIRANIDGSKYCIDIVNRLAKNTPGSKFLVVGKGEFFNHFEKADNLIWLNETLSHDEIIEVLNDAKFALMPTRIDAQGLMMCEMAAFGIPIITSDIPVCHEVFDDFINAFYISNDDELASLERFLNFDLKYIKDTRFYIENTVKKEIDIIMNSNSSRRMGKEC